MLLAADTRPSFLTERGDAYTPGVGSGRPVECCCRRTFKGGSRDCLFMLFAAGSLLPRPDRLRRRGHGRPYVRYARANIVRLAAIFVRNCRVFPTEVVPTVVEYWAQVVGR